MAAAPTNSISPQELKQRLDRGEELDMIDVRSPIAFLEVHIASARNVSLEQFDAAQVIRERIGSPESPLYILCESGTRTGFVCQKFSDIGFSNTVSVLGGVEACVAAGVPVVRDRSVISLDRQVRIVAGSVVLTGVLLAQFVHPSFLWLSGFIGAGLLFSGLSNTCTLGTLISFMPWNRR